MKLDKNKDNDNDKAFHIESLDFNVMGNETNVGNSQEIARNVREGISNDEIEFEKPKYLEKEEVLNHLLSKIGIKNLVIHERNFYIQNGIEFVKI
jgi:hypothetical protein